MGSLTLSTKYKKNTGLIISPEELISSYFYGLNITSNDGSKLDNEAVTLYIKAAQGEVERYFDVLLNKILVTETHDYYRDDYENGFPFVRVSYPVFSVKSLIGRLNGVDQIRYPEGWLQSRLSSTKRYYRQFSVVPNGSMVNADANVIMLGISAYYGLRSYPQIPYYWNVQYLTGYSPGDVPSELINLVGLLASIPLLCTYGDLVLSSPGLNSISLGVDGLSQSLSGKTNAFGERIKEYREQIKTTSDRLKRTFKGISFSAL